MLRILLLLVIVGLFFVACRWALRSARGMPRNKEEQVQHAVRCLHCQVYLAREEAVRAGEHFFCSLEHKKAFERDLQH